MNRSLLLFQNSLKSKETVESYTYYLDKFKDFASKDLSVGLDYDSLAGISLDKMQILVEDYIMELKKRVNPNSVPTFYFPIQSFCEARNWDQYHGAKDLAIGIITESAELLEHFRFKSEDEIENMFKSDKMKEITLNCFNRMFCAILKKWP